MVKPQTLHNACLEMLDGLSENLGTCLHRTAMGNELRLNNENGSGTMKCMALDHGVSAMIFDVILARPLTLLFDGISVSPIAHYLFIHEGKISNRCLNDDMLPSMITEMQCVVFKSDKKTKWSLGIHSETRLRMVLISVDMQRNHLIRYFASDNRGGDKNDKIALRFNYPVKTAGMLKKIFGIHSNGASALLRYKVLLFNLLSDQLSQFKHSSESKGDANIDPTRENTLPPINA